MKGGHSMDDCVCQSADMLILEVGNRWKLLERHSAVIMVILRQIMFLGMGKARDHQHIDHQ